MRDARWAEDHTRSQNWSLNANLAVRRAPLIARRAQRDDHGSWPAWFEQVSRHPALGLRLLTTLPK